MDATPKFIEMSEMATEIQEQWVLHFGDYCVVEQSSTREKVVVQVNDITTHIAIKGNRYKNWSIKPIDNKDVKWAWYDKSDYCIWLPTQDRLQDMIEASCALNLIGIFDDWLSDECFQPNVPMTVFKEVYENFSIEQLWLAFCQKTLYNKIWNDSTKKWEKTDEQS